MSQPESVAADQPVEGTEAAPTPAPGANASGTTEPAAPLQEGLLPFMNPGAVPMVLVLVVVTAVGVRALAAGTRRIGDRLTHRRLLLNQSQTIFGFMAWAAVFVIGLTSLFDLSSEAMLALSGTLAVAGGFLLKDVAESVLAGLSILVNKPFQVGDRIQFQGFYGEVKEIGLRSVRIVTVDDNLVTVPSSRFLSEPVANANSGSLECMVMMPFYLRPGSDHSRARQIVRDAVLSSRFLYLGKPVKVSVFVELADQIGTVIKLNASAYVYDARYEKAFESDVTDQALTAFREEGIELASALPPPVQAAS